MIQRESLSILTAEIRLGLNLFLRLLESWESAFTGLDMTALERDGTLSSVTILRSPAAKLYAPVCALGVTVDEVRSISAALSTVADKTSVDTSPLRSMFSILENSASRADGKDKPAHEVSSFTRRSSGGNRNAPRKRNARKVSRRRRSKPTG